MKSNSFARGVVVTLVLAFAIRAPAQQPTSTTAASDVGRASTGGGAQADFDTLIDLIQATVAPDSWDDVGGEGAIQSFPGGVYVNADGILRRLDASLTERLTPHWRRLNSVPPGDAVDGDFPQGVSGLRKVSLVGLLDTCLARSQRGLPPTPSMRHLAGLSRIDYLIIDDQRKDVILAGPAGPWRVDAEGRTVDAVSGRPVLKLDDLIVMLRNAFDRDGQFMCSITPTQRGLAAAQAFLNASREPIRPQDRDAWLDDLRSSLGLQRIEITGIDANTRVARVIVDADHHMKQIGIGLLPGGDGFECYLDRVVKSNKAEQPLDVLRWWFTLHPHAVEAAEHGKLYVFGRQSVQVLSENELLTRHGRRVRTGRPDPLNERFAADFTAAFTDLSRRYPVYADLDNLFRLAIAMAVIRHADVVHKYDWSLDGWRDVRRHQVGSGRAPRWVESIVNHRPVDRRRFVAAVSGGVQFDARRVRPANSTRRTFELTDSRQPRWWWD